MDTSREISVYIEDSTGLEFGTIEEQTLQKDLIDVISLISVIGWATYCCWDLADSSLLRGSMRIRVKFNHVTYFTERKLTHCVCGDYCYGSNHNQLKFIWKHVKLCAK